MLTACVRGVLEELKVDLAIFFWIMQVCRLTITKTEPEYLACYFLLNYALEQLQSTRRRKKVQTCYFLLNYAHKPGQFRPNPLSNVLELAIFFWIMLLVLRPSIGGRPAIVILLFSFELCNIWHCERSAKRRCICRLLFSFELCDRIYNDMRRTRRVGSCYFLLNYAYLFNSWIWRCHTVYCLLFSFELCLLLPA